MREERAEGWDEGLRLGFERKKSNQVSKTERMGKVRKNDRNRKLKFKNRLYHCSATSAGIDIAHPFMEKEKSCSKTLTDEPKFSCFREWENCENKMKEIGERERMGKNEF